MSACVSETSFGMKYIEFWAKKYVYKEYWSFYQLCLEFPGRYERSAESPVSDCIKRLSSKSNIPNFHGLCQFPMIWRLFELLCKVFCWVRSFRTSCWDHRVSAEHNSSAANGSTVYRIGSTSSCWAMPLGNWVGFFPVTKGIKHSIAPLIVYCVSFGREISVAFFWSEKKDREAMYWF